MTKQVTKNSGLTRSGARRGGDYFQDAITGDFLIKWLEEPSKYRYVRLENPEAGSLDDITACAWNGKLVLVQVKYTTDSASRLLTFDYLLEKPKGNNSLLEKWSASLESYPSDEVESVTLKTNRTPNGTLGECLMRDGRIDISCLQATVQKAIFDQLGEQKARHLLGVLVVEANLPGIGEVESSGRATLARLNPSRPEAWDSLMRAIREWVISPSSLPENPRIRLSDVHTAALWFDLRQVNEQFVVPPDMVLPDDNEVQSLLANLDSHGRVLEIIGAPGSGKSTLLAWLRDRLQAGGDVVLRHHFFVSLNDATQHRFSAVVTVESLLSQMVEARQLNAEEEPESPDPSQQAQLRRWLEVAAAKLRSDQHRLVVIIDGLDHAFHESERAKDELQELFRIILPPPDGMYVILGSQFIRRELLPDALNAWTDDTNTVSVPLLSTAAMERWLVEYGSASMNVESAVLDSPDRCRRLAKAIVDASGGLPLAFRLLQNQLVAAGMPVDESSVSRLPETITGDIQKYYGLLWVHLSVAAATILCLLVQYPWAWPVEGIRQCLVHGGYEPNSVTQAVSEVRHLLSQDTGPVTVFHISLAWFVKDQPFFSESGSQVSKMTVQWLQEDAPDTYRRAHLWVVKAGVGDPADLIKQPERSWLIDSLQHHTPRRYISNILEQSGRIALMQGQLDLFARRSLLQDYVTDIFDYNSDTRETIGVLLDGQLERHGVDLSDQLLGEVADLSDKELRGLFHYLVRIGNTPGMQKCFAVILQRIKKDTRDDLHEHETGDVVACYADMLSVLSDTSPDDLIALIQRNRESGWAQTIAADLGKAILRNKRVALAHAFLVRASELQVQEKAVCFPWLCALLLEQASCIPSDAAAAEPDSGPWPALLLELMTPQSDDIKNPATDPEGLDMVFVDDSWGERRPSRPDRIVDLFFRFLVDTTNGNRNSVDDFCSRTPSGKKISSFVHLLAEAARNISNELIVDGTRAAIPLYSTFEALDPGSAAQGGLEGLLMGDCRKALVDIMLLSSFLAPSRQRQRAKVEMATALSSKWFFPDALVQSLIGLHRASSWSSAAGIACQSFISQLRVDMNGFSGCAGRLALYAEFARQAKVDEPGLKWTDLADTSCEYLVTYGNHKDILMYDLLKSAEELSAADPKGAFSIVSAIAGPALSARSFTDGDETSDLPSTLGSTMASVCPDQLLPYFRWLEGHESYDDAAHAFACWIATSPFKTRFHEALATTSSDSESVGELKKRSQAGLGAQHALALVESRFGGVEGILGSDAPNSSGSYAGQTESLPDPSLYPPAELSAFLAAARQSAWNGDRAADWLHYWTESGKGPEAAASMERQYRWDWRGTDVGIRTYREMCSIIGRDDAFIWLVRANQGIHGWLSYYWEASRSETLWNEIRIHYPEQWLRFVNETVYSEESSARVGSRGMLSWLTRYLVLQGQVIAAGNLTEGACILLEQLIPTKIPVDLAVPEWVEQ